MLSSIYGVHPTNKCKRYNKSEKKYIEVERPKVIQAYNTNMGGVDLFDRMLSYCPMRARTKKWTIRTIFHLIDMCVANAWLQFKYDQVKRGVVTKKIPQYRKFKLMLGETFIYLHKENEAENGDDEDMETEPQVKKRKVPVPLPHENLRKSKCEHMPAVEDVKDWQKCRRPGCNARTRTLCITCKIFLCLGAKRNCFKMFHES